MLPPLFVATPTKGRMPDALHTEEEMLRERYVGTPSLAMASGNDRLLYATLDSPTHISASGV